MFMKNATGPAFPIYGFTSFKISNKNKTDSVNVKALVVHGLNHPLLITWLVFVQLRLIHPTFPLTSIDEYCSTHCSFITVNNTSSPKIDIRKLLINEFLDVIPDSLNPIPAKTDPMHIYLKETDERPLHFSTACQIPKHFQAAAELKE